MAANTESRSSEGARNLIRDAPHAPFIYFEVAPAFGLTHGVINLTLSAHRTLMQPDGKVTTEQVVVAYLRGSVQAARSLRQAIDNALLLATPSEGKMS